MNTQRKTISLMIVVSIISLLVMLFINYESSYKALYNFEKKQIENKNEVLKSILRQETIYLKAGVKDWSVWDDTYKFLDDRNEGYRQANITYQTFSNLKIDLFALLDNDLKLVDGCEVNDVEKKANPLEGDLLNIIREMIRDKKAESFVLKHHNTYIIAHVSRIYPTDKEGKVPSNGFLIMGRKMDDEVRIWEKYLNLEPNTLTITNLFYNGEEIAYKRNNHNFSENEFVNYTNVGVDRMDIEYYVSIPEFTSCYVKFLAKTNRNEMKIGISNLHSSLIAIVVISIAMLSTMIYVVRRIVIYPLMELKNDVVLIQEWKIKTLEIGNSHNEFFVLRKSINSMLDSIIQGKEKEEELKNQLYHAEKLQAIGRLAGGIAHDFNNMLAAIIGYTDLLAGMNLPTKAKEYVNVILKGARRSADLVSKLLIFSRRSKVDKKPLYLHAVIDEVYKLLFNTVNKNIEMVKSLNAKQCSVSGDFSQLQTVVMNFCINSIDSMPDGGKLILSTINENENVILRIEDSGTGIPDEIQSKIFDPFFTTKDIGKGTGLGLSTVYGIVQAHEGNVMLESSVKGKTVFVISLPICKEKVNELDLEKETSSGGGYEVMIVDDEDMVRNLMKELFSSGGFKVTDFNNGREAVEVYRKFHKAIHVVLLDMQMPGMNGDEVLVALREINPECKVVIVSGYAEEESELKVKDKKVQGFIQKPFSRNKLIETVDRICREKK